jgi:chemotaxis protein histidine kinase CheA
MRGKIDVTSELNKGTTFTIKMPVTGEYKEKSLCNPDENFDSVNN